MDFIDVVYCWICGENEQVRKSMKRVGLKMSKDRCFSNGLIQHSLRLFVHHSTHKGRIIIVSHSGVCPTGIQDICDRITVIDQCSIIPDEYNPTFNNMVVECFLHRIPNVTCPFLYMNDDYLMTNHLSMDNLVGGDKVNMYCSNLSMDTFVFANSGTVWDRMVINNAKIANARLGRCMGSMRLMQHMPYVLYPTVMEDICQEFKEAIDVMGARHSGRSETDIIMVFLHQEWWIANYPNKVRIITLTGDTEPSYAFVSYSFNTIRHIMHMISNKKTQFLTLSEGATSYHPTLHRLLEESVWSVCN